MTRVITQADVDRFLRKFSTGPADECWEWKAGRDKYGYFKIGSKRDKTNVMAKAHRVAFYVATGEWPEVVMHHCDNPACINPRHLAGATQIENCLDRDRKNRVAHGSSHCRAKLTEADVVAIRADTRTTAAIALDYDISQPLVHRIKSRQQWRRV